MKIETVIIFFLACIAHVACNKDPEGFLNDIPSVEGYQHLKLNDTGWQLIGFADAQRRTLKPVNPDSEKLFSLRFHEFYALSGWFSGWSSIREIRGGYKTSSESSIMMDVAKSPYYPETDDGDMYIECLNSVHTFSITEKGLALYYDRYKFLLFKPVDIPFLEGFQNLQLTDAEWSMIGFVDAEQETLKAVKPDLSYHFKLWFWADNTFWCWSSSHFDIWGVYRTSSESSITIEDFSINYRLESDDGVLYLESLNNAKTFLTTEKGLELYYDSNKFLFFYPIDICFFNDIPSVEGYKNLQLTDVGWQLIGFADAEREIIRTVNSGAFTLWFYDDRSLSGRSSGNQMMGGYEIFSESSLTIGVFLLTEVNETYKGEMYLEWLNSVKTFSMTEKGLALFYDSNKYLLFKPIEL